MAIIINHDGPVFFNDATHPHPPLLKLEGLQNKLTMLIEYCCPGASARLTEAPASLPDAAASEAGYPLGLTPWTFNPLQRYINSAATLTFLDRGRWRRRVLSVRGHVTDEVYEAEAKLCFISLRQLLRVCALGAEASLHFGGLLLTW